MTGKEKAKIASFEDCFKIMDRVLQYGRPVCARFKTKTEAEGLRFRCYRARKEMKKLEAQVMNVGIEEIGLDYDRIIFKIEMGYHPETKELEWLLKIIPAEKIELDLFDLETGEEIELGNTPPHQSSYIPPEPATDFYSTEDTFDDDLNSLRLNQAPGDEDSLAGGSE